MLLNVYKFLGNILKRESWKKKKSMQQNKFNVNGNIGKKRDKKIKFNNKKQNKKIWKE